MSKSPIDKLLHRELTRKEFLLLTGAVAATAVGITGVIRELLSQAATPTASLEPEAGAITAPAKKVADSTASAGSALQFSPATSGGSKTIFGACPGQETNTEAAFFSKWGNGAAYRRFYDPNQTLLTWTRPANAGISHVSWKPDNGSGKPRTTTLTTAEVLAAVKNLKAGDMVEVWHESDVKFRDNNFTQAQAETAVARKNELYNIIKANRPELLVVTTYAAWMFQSDSLYNGTAPDGAQWWSRVKADVVGIDCDGIGNLTRYPDFANAITNVQAYIKKYAATSGYSKWSVPEFIHPRLDGTNGEAVFDSDGTKRAAWAKLHADRFRNAAIPAYVVHLFDTNSNAVNGRTGQIFVTGSPEHTAWKQYTSGAV